MSIARGIEVQSRVLIPGQAIVKSSEVPGTATATGRINESAAPSEDAADFRQRLQAVFDALERVVEQITDKDASPANGEPSLICDGTSCPASATGLHSADDHDVKGINKFTSYTTRWSDLPRTNVRKTLHVSPLDISFGPNANLPSSSTVGHDSTLDSQRASGSSKKPATIETTAKSFTTASAANPEFPLTSTVMPAEALSPQAFKPSSEVTHPMASPSGRAKGEPAILTFNRWTAASNDGRTTPVTTPEVAPDNDPAAASYPSQVASWSTSTEVSDADRLVSATLSKVSAQAVPSTLSQQLLQNSSIEPSASESVSATATGMHDLPLALLDKAIEQGKNPATSDTTAMGASKPGAPRNHTNGREPITHSSSRLEPELSSTQSASSLAGAEPLGDSRTGQFALFPAAGLLPIHGDGFTIAANEHLAAAREPLNAMDAGLNDRAPTWVRAETHRAEAGFQDPSLGWVSVRAHADGGGIHAVLVPSSDMASQVLGGHLAGLNAHLADHHEHLHSITLSTPDPGWNNRNTGRDMAQGNGADTSHGREQQHMREDRASVQTDSVAHSSRAISEEPLSVVQLQTITAFPNPMDGHVSFVV